MKTMIQCSRSHREGVYIVVPGAFINDNGFRSSLGVRTGARTPGLVSKGVGEGSTTECAADVEQLVPWSGAC